MNKDKLIGLIVKKQQYKETKLVQSDIARKKQEAVNVSIGAIHQILKDQYNAEAKLYAVRYLRDCFEKGNPSFITKTENKILPLIEDIIRDSSDERKVMSYAGSSFSKNADLQKFKSIVMSLFVMCRECVENWGSWISDPSRQFYQLKQKLRQQIPIERKRSFQYFKKQNEVLFRENCQRNGFLLPPAKSSLSEIENTQNQFLSESLHSNYQKKSQLSSLGSKLAMKIQEILQSAEEKVSQSQLMSQSEINHFEDKFNEAFDQFIEEAKDVDSQFLESFMERFEKVKEVNLQKKQAQIQKDELSRSDSNLHKKLRKSLKNEKNRIQSEIISEYMPIQSNSRFNQIKGYDTKSQKRREERSSKSQSKVIFDRSRYSQQRSDKFRDSNEFKETNKFLPEQEYQIHTFKKLAPKVERISEKKAESGSISKIMDDFQQTKKQKTKLQQQVKNLQMEVLMLKEGEKQLIDHVNQVNQEKKYKKLQNKLNQEKKQKYLLYQQIEELRNQLRRLSRKVDSSASSQLSASKMSPSQLSSKYKIKKLKTQNEESEIMQTISKVKSTSALNSFVVPPLKTIRNQNLPRIDEDYINNGAYLKNLESWLSNENVYLFKKSVLKGCSTFFQSDKLKISKVQNVFERQGFDLLKYKQYHLPKSIYKNIEEIDLWIKPISGKQNVFVQELMGRLCGNPLKFIKAYITDDTNSKTQFFLPIMFYSYLKIMDVEGQQFERIFIGRKERILKSNVLKINNKLASNTNEIQQLFNPSEIRQNCVEFCLSQESKQNAFLVQIEMVRNEKMVIRVSAIPWNPLMNCKAKELLNNLIFLLSE